jgi:hypothetical protein
MGRRLADLDLDWMAVRVPWLSDALAAATEVQLACVCVMVRNLGGKTSPHISCRLLTTIISPSAGCA